MFTKCLKYFYLLTFSKWMHNLLRSLWKAMGDAHNFHSNWFLFSKAELINASELPPIRSNLSSDSCLNSFPLSGIKAKKSSLYQFAFTQYFQISWQMQIFDWNSVQTLWDKQIKLLYIFLFGTFILCIFVKKNPPA